MRTCKRRSSDDACAPQTHLGSAASAPRPVARSNQPHKKRRPACPKPSRQHITQQCCDGSFVLKGRGCHTSTRKPPRGTDALHSLTHKYTYAHIHAQHTPTANPLSGGSLLRHVQRDVAGNLFARLPRQKTCTQKIRATSANRMYASTGFRMNGWLQGSSRKLTQLRACTGQFAWYGMVRYAQGFA